MAIIKVDNSINFVSQLAESANSILKSQPNLWYQLDQQMRGLCTVFNKNQFSLNNSNNVIYQNNGLYYCLVNNSGNPTISPNHLEFRNPNSTGLASKGQGSLGIVEEMEFGAVMTKDKFIIKLNDESPYHINEANFQVIDSITEEYLEDGEFNQASLIRMFGYMICRFVQQNKLSVDDSYLDRRGGDVHPSRSLINIIGMLESGKLYTESDFFKLTKDVLRKKNALMQNLLTCFSSLSENVEVDVANIKVPEMVSMSGETINGNHADLYPRRMVWLEIVGVSMRTNLTDKLYIRIEDGGLLPPEIMIGEYDSITDTHRVIPLAKFPDVKPHWI